MRTKRKPCESHGSTAPAVKQHLGSVYDMLAHVLPIYVEDLIFGLFCKSPSLLRRRMRREMKMRRFPNAVGFSYLSARSFWFSAPSFQLQMAEENHADARLSRLLLPQARIRDEEIAATEVDVSVFFMTPTVTQG